VFGEIKSAKDFTGDAGRGCAWSLRCREAVRQRASPVAITDWTVWCGMSGIIRLGSSVWMYFSSRSFNSSKFSEIMKSATSLPLMVWAPFGNPRRSQSRLGRQRR
jgi:hypothetical protein